MNDRIAQDLPMQALPTQDLPAAPEPFEVAYAGKTAELPAIVVCILTLRRPDDLALTLRSLAAQDFARPFACLVADNDPAGREGAVRAEAMMREGVVAGAAVVVARPGHSSACNGVFAAVRALFPDTPLVAMIDDDELAEPDWLRRIVDAQERSGADLVGGPVLPRFERPDAGRFAGHPVFTPYYTASGPVPFLYGSGNFAMRAHVLDQLGQPYLDPAFDFVGGGDFDFFKRARDAGFTAYFEAGARAVETVPPGRTSLRWVVARSLRYGAINYMIERKNARRPLDRLRIPAKSLVLLGLGPLRGLRHLAASRDVLAASHPILEALGRIMAQVGLRPEQYRQRGPRPS